MTFSMIISLLVAPAIFWMGYFYYKDRFFPEPIAKTLITFFMGFIAAFLCCHFYRVLPLIGIPADPSELMGRSQGLFFLYCIGVIGVVEEIFKFLPFLLLVSRFSDFDEIVDGIIYASVIALGFATFENIYYLPLLQGWHLLGRALASPLVHTVFSSIWGYWVARALLFRKSLVPVSLTWLSVSAFSHGLFDFLTWNPSLRLLSAVLILLVWIWRIVIIEKHNQEGSVSSQVR